MIRLSGFIFLLEVIWGQELCFIQYEVDFVVVICKLIFGNSSVFLLSILSFWGNCTSSDLFLYWLFPSFNVCFGEIYNPSLLYLDHDTGRHRLEIQWSSLYKPIGKKSPKGNMFEEGVIALGFRPGPQWMSND